MRAVRVAVGLVVGAGLVLLFLRLVNMGAVYHRLQNLQAGYAIICGVCFLGAFVVRGLRWRCLLRPCRVSIGHAVGIYQVAVFLNWLLPVRAGELAMSLLLRRTDGIPVARSLATVSMDKAMDLLPAVVLLAAVPFLPVHLIGPVWVLLLLALAAIAAGAAVLLLASRRPESARALLTRPLRKVLPRRAGQRAESVVVTFLDTLLALIRRPRILLAAAAYTVLAVTLDTGSCWAAFRAVGVPVGVAVVLFGYTLFNFSFILPSPPGQLGSNELIGFLIFSETFGVSRSGVGAMFLFSHPFTSILMTCSGLACLSLMGLSLRSALRFNYEPDAELAAEPVAEPAVGPEADSAREPSELAEPEPQGIGTGKWSGSLGR
jgi:uncharacterized protein (TIRG00374 family)